MTFRSSHFSKNYYSNQSVLQFEKTDKLSEETAQLVIFGKVYTDIRSSTVVGGAASAPLDQSWWTEYM